MTLIEDHWMKGMGENKEIVGMSLIVLHISILLSRD